VQVPSRASDFPPCTSMNCAREARPASRASSAKVE